MWNKQEYERVKRRLEFPEYFPVIQDFLAADDKIYVVTFKSIDDKKEVLVYDLGGKFLKKVYFPGIEQSPFQLYPFTVRNGNLYRLHDNDETEEWELFISKIE